MRIRTTFKQSPVGVTGPVIRHLPLGKAEGKLRFCCNVTACAEDARARHSPPVLVPLGLCEAARTTVEYAIRVASGLKASVVLLHVVDRTCPGGFPGLPVRCRLRTEARGRAERCLATIAELHEGSGVTIECLVRDGVPEYEILRLAEALGAELIVLGRTQRNLLNRLLLGSVSREVLACSRRPVMVVPPDALTCHRATQRQVREAQTDHDLSATMEDRS